MSKLKFSPFLLSVSGLLVVSALAYLPHLPRLGYYNDDWYVMYDAFTQGTSFFTHIFRSDRPGRAPIMMFFYTLFGPHALYYHISAYFFRVLSGISVLWIFQQIWPGRAKTNFLIALLFLVYPGFLSQINAIDYQSHILALFSVFFSIGLTLRAVSSPPGWKQIVLSVAAILTGWLYLSQMEYFIGLEAFRLLMVYLLISERGPQAIWQKIRSSLASWFIFIIIPIGFLLWRLFFFSAERRATDIGAQLGQSLTSPIALMWWLVYLVQDAFNVLVTGWVWPVYNLGFQMRLSDTLIALSLSALAFGLAWWLDKRQQDEMDLPDIGETLSIGLLALLAGQLPVILANRHISFPDYSRYALVGIAGMALIFGIALAHVRNRQIRTVLLALMLFSAILTHYANGLKAASEWNMMRNFWWQVSWRIPDLKDDTTLLASYPSLAIQEDYFIWGPANLIYRPSKQDSIPIKIPIPAAVLTDNIMFRVMQGRGSETQERRGNLSVRDFGNVLVLTQASETGCVRVLDGNTAELSTQDQHRILLIGEMSKLDNVLTTGSFHTPPPEFFGSEPQNGWCYYYQKATLARQIGNWQEVARLGNKALAEGYYPSDRVEWMPFLQAYAALDQQNNLKRIIPIFLEEPFLTIQACKNLKKMSAGGSISPEMQQFIQQSLCE